MAVLNKILNVLIFILSIAAMYFSYVLWQQRDELRDRGDTIAKTVFEASKRIEGIKPAAVTKGKPQEEYLKSNFKNYKNGNNATVSYFHGGAYMQDDAKPHNLPLAEPEAIKLYKAKMELKKPGSTNNLKPKSTIADGGALSWSTFKAERDADLLANKTNKDFKFTVWSNNKVNTSTTWSKKLTVFLDQVDRVMKQRDYIVKHVNKMAIELGSTLKGFNKDEYKVEDMAMVGAKSGKDNGTYAPKALRLEKLAKANSDRTNALIKAIGQWYLKVENTEVEMDEDPFRTLKKVEGSPSVFDYKEQLAEITTDLGNLRTRMDDTAKSFAEGVEKLVSDEFSKQTTGKDLLRKDPDVYGKALSSFVEDMTAINGKLEELTKTKADLVQKNIELEKVTKKLAELKKELGDKNQSFKATKYKLKMMQQKLDRLERKLPPAIFKELDTTARGVITTYNNEFGFVVFDLGVTDQGKYQVVPYIDMLVMRGERYIGRVRVTEVKVGKSIAEVHQVVAGEKIKVGDKVIFKESSGVELEAQYKSEKAKADAKEAKKEAAALEEELGRKEKEEEE